MTATVRNARSEDRVTAALFVATGGPYFGLPDVDPWDEKRDARKYRGPWPVVAHPPCERWGRYATGGPNPKAKRRKPGDDGGCFAAALNAVLKYGGVIEHPADSLAWAHFGILSPNSGGGWQAQLYRGQMIWTCEVEQGHYGHRARKRTWLLAAKVKHLPALKWGPSSGQRLEEGFHSSRERLRARAAGIKPVKRISVIDRIHTPKPFRDLLLQIAGQRSAA